jgi:hypothetical protein
MQPGRSTSRAARSCGGCGEADLGEGKATATLPEGASVWFINIIDERGLTVSSEYEEL